MKKNKDIKSSPLDVYNFSSDSEESKQVTEYDTRDEDEFYDDFDNDVSEHRSRVDQNHTSASNWLKKILSFIFFLLMLAVLSGIGLFAYYAKDAPVISTAKLQSGGSSSLYTTDGKLLLSLGSDKRNYLKSSEIPQQLKDAIVSVEDKRFYHEPLGIDPIRIVGSFADNIIGHDISSGGSSITQQLVKLSVFSTDASQRTLRRKAQEAWLAMQISREYPKEQILEFYINKVYMNYNNYGIGTAANYYFDKDVSELNLSQTALLAGMPNAPTVYDPYLHPSSAKYRRDIVLAAMFNNGKITKYQYRQALNTSITDGLVKKHADDFSLTRKIDDPYIKEAVNEVKEKGFDPYTSNLKITVNIDQDAQNHLYNLANGTKIPFTNKKMQVGSTIIDPTNGHVLAIIGGRHLPNVQLGLNRAAQTTRSTGSSIKPILDYAPAIEYKHWSTAQSLLDTPYTYAGTNIQLYDWDNRYLGPVSMRYALEQSRNVPAVRTLETVGLIRASKFAKRMGINIEQKQGLSVAIGANASSIQMAGAYSALADDGIYHKPQFVSKIETPDGIIQNYDAPGTRVMKDSTAYMITDMLKGVITKGSGTQAKIKDVYQAGKTGTVKYSNEELKAYPSYQGTPKDSWFVGYTKNYVMSVWSGYDNLKDGQISGNGQNAAQVLYREMMSYLMRDVANRDWDKPDSVVTRNGELYVKGHAPKLPKRRTPRVPYNQSRTYYYRNNTRYYYYRRYPYQSNQRQNQNR